MQQELGLAILEVGREEVLQENLKREKSLSSIGMDRKKIR
jgi:hypothetical protein